MANDTDVIETGAVENYLSALNDKDLLVQLNWDQWLEGDSRSVFLCAELDSA